MILICPFQMSANLQRGNNWQIPWQLRAVRLEPAMTPYLIANYDLYLATFAFFRLWTLSIFFLESRLHVRSAGRAQRPSLRRRWRRWTGPTTRTASPAHSARSPSTAFRCIQLYSGHAQRSEFVISSVHTYFQFFISSDNKAICGTCYARYVSIHLWPFFHAQA